MLKNIFLSIVLSSRNDGYPEGRGHKLLIYSIKHLMNKLQEINHNFEIILIDYNPPSKKNKLHEIVKLKKIKNISLKIIEVEYKYHKKLKYSQYFPICQELAFNVGIQRSNGKFILTKNADTVIGDKFFQYLKYNKLTTKNIYRCARVDLSVEDFLSNNLDFNGNSEFNMTCGDFILMSNQSWNKIKGWWENGEAYQDGSDSLVVESAKKLNIKELYLKDFVIYKPKHNLLHLNRTSYRYDRIKFKLLDNLVFFIKRILFRLSIKQRKAEIISRDGSMTNVLINIYCYDLIRKIRSNKLNVPLNQDRLWGLKNISLVERIL